MVGLRAASWRYFGKQVEDLTWAQSATLAVLPNAPSLIHVNRNRAELMAKRNSLLQRLKENGTLSDLDLDAALLESLPNKLENLPSYAPHYLEYCKNGNGNFHTSIQGELQKKIGSVCEQLAQEWNQNGIYNAGVVVLSIETGEPLAYIGNIPGTPEEDQVDMIQARRSSGSILKPFLYASMIDEGLMSPFEIQRDVPIYIGGFSPSNYNKDYAGFIHADDALQRSLNVPAVLMLQQYGVDKFLRKLKQFGITTLSQSADHYGLSLILGGGEVTLWQLAHAYRNLVRCHSGEEEMISSGAAYHTLHTLTEVNRPNESGAWQRFSSSIPLSWKTGTSYGHRDAWAVGVTPEHAIAVWVGNADGEGRAGLVGSTTAGRLLFRILDHIDYAPKKFDIPYEEMIEGRICPESGMLAGQHCPDSVIKEIAIMVTRTPPCVYHKIFYTDSVGQYRLGEACSLTQVGVWNSYLTLDAVGAKYYRLNHPDYEGIPPWHPNCRMYDPSNHPIRFVYPNATEKIYLPVDLNAQKQDVVFEIAHQNPQAEIFWYLDEQFLGRTTGQHKIALHPSVGSHKVTVLDISGVSKERYFDVLAN